MKGLSSFLKQVIVPSAVKKVQDQIDLPPAVETLLTLGVDGLVNRAELMHPESGNGADKRATVAGDIAAFLLPSLELLTGRNINDPRVLALLLELSDTTVKMKNAQSAVIECQHALNEAIRETVRVKTDLQAAIAAVKEPAR